MTSATKETLATVKSLGSSIAVKRLEEPAAWYMKELGFEIVQRRDFLEYSTRIAFLETNGVRIALIKERRWSPVHPPGSAAATDHAGGR